MPQSAIRILGVDPGLSATGWGVVEVEGSRLTFCACRSVPAGAGMSLSRRLAFIHRELAGLIAEHRPDEGAVEETFVNRDPRSALKLGQARGVALAALALANFNVAEYGANLVKKR